MESAVLSGSLFPLFTSTVCLRLVRPDPVRRLRFVDSELVSVVAAFNLLVEESLLGVAANLLQPGHAIYDVHCQTETISVVIDREFQRSVNVALFLVAADVNVVMIRAPVGEAMDELWIAMEVEHHGLVDSEQRIKVAIRQAMRMFAGRLQFEKIDNVDETDFEIGELFSEERDRRQSLLGGNITC